MVTEPGRSALERRRVVAARRKQTGNLVNFVGARGGRRGRRTLVVPDFARLGGGQGRVLRRKRPDKRVGRGQGPAVLVVLEYVVGDSGRNVLRVEVDDGLAAASAAGREVGGSVAAIGRLL